MSPNKQCTSIWSIDDSVRFFISFLVIFGRKNWCNPTLWFLSILEHCAILQNAVRFFGSCTAKMKDVSSKSVKCQFWLFSPRINREKCWFFIYFFHQVCSFHYEKTVFGRSFYWETDRSRSECSIVPVSYFTYNKTVLWR